MAELPKAALTKGKITRLIQNILTSTNTFVEVEINIIKLTNVLCPKLVDRQQLKQEHNGRN